MNKKKSVYVEKISKDKTEKQIKNDLVDIVIPHFHVDSNLKQLAIIDIDKYNEDDKKILKAKNPILNQYIPFFYLNMTQIRQIKDEGTMNSILAYLNKIKDDITYALGFPQKHQEIYDTIIAIDRVDEKDIYSTPRGKKLNRLKMVHKNILEYFMKTLHDMYWVSISSNYKSGKSIDYYIQSLFPVIKILVHNLEAEVDKEYPPDLIEKQMKVEYKKR